ncbi:MAG: zinc ABC transporter substrate-binding protein [Candidatus Dadabacteria bacterium]|nr:zinc ABC transporter substrate-binding protein [Candidatus Dadabacteria bacterium]
MMRIFLTVFAAFAAIAGGARASEMTVAASIAPVHSLVANVTEGVNTAELIVPAVESPHVFSLKPSHVRKITNAKAVFFISGGFETFLEGALGALPRGARKVALAERAGVSKLKNRHGGGDDLHIWLSPKNAEAITVEIARQMSAVNPRARSAYKRNARKTVKKLRALDAAIKKRLKGAGGVPYATFHDAFGYFERSYGLTFAGAISANPESGLSVADIKRVRESGAACIFYEPQFGSKAAETAARGTGAKVGMVDPLGADITPGPELYFTLMENLAKSFADCLKGAS